MTPRKIVVLILLGIVSSLSAAGQTTSGSIAGEVHDTQGAAMAGAKVTATNADKNTSTTTVTEATGRFVFPQLLPGRYKLGVEMAGFKKFERQDVVLNANDNLSVGTLALELGTLVQTVEVRAEGLLLKTESAERSDALVGQQLQNIEVNGRSFRVTPQRARYNQELTAGDADPVGFRS